MHRIRRISNIVLPGHTPGMAILKLKLENKILLFTSDIFHSIMQFTRRDWYSVFDIDSKTAEVTNSCLNFWKAMHI